MQAALNKENLTVSGLDFREINETFGAVITRLQVVLGISNDAVNSHGGGIAMGHPIDAAGFAGVAPWGGGGQGEALTLRR